VAQAKSQEPEEGDATPSKFVATPAAPVAPAAEATASEESLDQNPLAAMSELSANQQQDLIEQIVEQ